MAENSKEPYMNDTEKKILTELVGNYKNIIENKEISKIMTAKKTAAWKTLASEFNSKVTPENEANDPKVVIRRREWDKLKKAWENLKTRTKKEVQICKIFQNFDTQITSNIFGSLLIN